MYVVNKKYAVLRIFIYQRVINAESSEP